MSEYDDLLASLDNERDNPREIDAAAAIRSLLAERDALKALLAEARDDVSECLQHAISTRYKQHRVTYYRDLLGRIDAALAAGEVEQ